MSNYIRRNSNPTVMKRRIIFGLVACLSVTILSAQSLKKLISEAHLTFYDEKFEEALQQYEYIHGLFPDNDSINYHKEIAFLLTEGRGTSYQKLIDFGEVKARKDKFYHYWLGRVYLSNYEFELARKHLQMFLNVKAYKSDIIIGETKMFMSQIDEALLAYNNPSDYEIERLPAPINSKFQDLSPSFLRDNKELLFLSSRPTEDVYEAETFHVFHSTSNGHVWEESLLIESFGDFTFDNAKIEVVNKDGKAFVHKDDNGGNLYFSNPSEESWGPLLEFDTKIRSSLLESHFFINDDQNLVVFASKKGGNLDLYQSIRNNTGEWSKAIPLNINSEDDEDSPYISHDGKYLYFSSNRPASVGGFDVFRSEWDDKNARWGNAINLGFPINTIDNEIHFQLNEDNISGYLSSDRLHGYGGYDIYSFKHMETIMVAGTCVDEVTGPIKNQKVTFHPLKYEDESFTAYTDVNGRYSVKLLANEEYDVEIEFDGYKVHAEHYSTEFALGTTLLSKDFTFLIPADHPVFVDATTEFEGENEQLSDINMLGSKFRVGKKAITRNIYFEPGSSSIKEESAETVLAIYDLLAHNPEIILEISGHTDNLGTHDHNMKLSLERAESVIEKVSQLGVDRSRMTSIGYGETQPLASNDDEKNGRELNRRIEIIVIEANRIQLSSNP